VVFKFRSEKENTAEGGNVSCTNRIRSEFKHVFFFALRRVQGLQSFGVALGGVPDFVFWACSALCSHFTLVVFAVVAQV
jgi:hypothetical protein